ncbi:hypothetical protein NG819_03670 [Pseudarthrobacter sp. Fe7]|nr:hypothetical protein NG819_03670 [Pseudarthrobacter sp. Fe7]
MPALRNDGAKATHRYQNETSPAGTPSMFRSTMKSRSRRRWPLAAGLAAALLGAGSLGLGLTHSDGAGDMARVASAADAGSDAATQAPEAVPSPVAPAPAPVPAVAAPSPELAPPAPAACARRGGSCAPIPHRNGAGRSTAGQQRGPRARRRSGQLDHDLRR